MRNLKLLLIIACIMGLSLTRSSALAQAVIHLARQEEEMLSLFYRVTRLATRTEREQSKTHVATTIITRSTIERMGARTIEDVFRLIPGMQLGKSPIGYPRLALRGLPNQGTEKIKVFLDGHDVSSALTDGAAFFLNNFPAELVEKLEVIRGPGSALYGSDALSGVINIVTIPAAIEGAGIVGSVNHGSWDTTRLAGRVAVPTKSGWAVGGVSYLHTNGANVHVARDALGRPGRTNEREERTDALLAFKSRGFKFHGYYLNDSSGGYYNPGFFLTDKTTTSWEQFFSDLTYEQGFLHNALAFKGKIFFNRHKHHFDIFFRPEGWVNPTGVKYPGGIVTMTRGYMDNYGGTWEATYRFSSAHALTLGFEARQEELRGLATKANYDPRPLPEVQDVSKTFGWIEPADRFFWGGFGQYQWDFSQDAYIVTGLRYDYYDDVGDVLSPNVGIYWGFSTGKSISFHYAKGFRAPAFREMYKRAPGPPIIGNPRLKSEESQGIDVTLRWRLSDLVGIGATLFYSEVDDLIVAQELRFQNVGNLRSRGIETSLDARWHKFSLLMNCAYVKSQMDGHDFAGISNWIVSALFSYDLSKGWWLGSLVYFAGPSDVYSGGLGREVDDYTNIDLILGARRLFHGTHGPDLIVAIRNLLDDEYSYPEVTGAVPHGLKQPGLSVDARVTFRF